MIDNNNHHSEAISSDSAQTSASSKPHKEKDEEEPQTDQQGSYESDAYVELRESGEKLQSRSFLRTIPFVHIFIHLSFNQLFL
ncbi:hypothetical protein OJAV_G00075900 [Oryzias javanicus]|uniref:Uncharacterized protein n=1 Tax=Oryzias javanicus TaxID=123683 RepID=A0A3S2P8I8_ORYJA|nr:hypothetical protein OJAV_G00075900 [Oryzias javanicus]